MHIIKLYAAGSLRYPAALFLYHCTPNCFHSVFHRNSADVYMTQTSKYNSEYGWQVLRLMMLSVAMVMHHLWQMN